MGNFYFYLVQFQIMQIYNKQDKSMFMITEKLDEQMLSTDQISRPGGSQIEIRKFF